MVDDIRFDGLPVKWNALDIGAFSCTKRLWDYQRKAVENAIKALWKHYEDFHDYQSSENAEANREGKEKFSWSKGTAHRRIHGTFHQHRC